MDVFKAVRAPLPPAYVRSVLAAACSVPEVRARLLVRAGGVGSGSAFGSGSGSVEVAVRITGDRELRRLNRAFLGEDHATDVLSFPSGDPGGYLGDIAVSWPYAARQAGLFGHSALDEVALLLVHGLLHLLGWDHASAREAGEMNRVTLAALAVSGVSLGDLRLSGESAR